MIFNRCLLKAGFVTTNVEIVNLKLIDAGISGELITVINNLSSVMTIVIPIAVGKFISGPKTMNIFLQSTIFRFVIPHSALRPIV